MHAPAIRNTSMKMPQNPYKGSSVGSQRDLHWSCDSPGAVLSNQAVKEAKTIELSCVQNHGPHVYTIWRVGGE